MISISDGQLRLGSVVAALGVGLVGSGDDAIAVGATASVAINGTDESLFSDGGFSRLQPPATAKIPIRCSIFPQRIVFSDPNAKNSSISSQLFAKSFIAPRASKAGN